MQIITTESAITGARAFYEAGKLTAQQTNDALRRCYYQIDGCRCAVGAGLTDETLAKIGFGAFNAESVHRLDLHIFEFADIPTKRFVERLQTIHDKWCRSSESHEDSFREIIGLPQKGEPACISFTSTG